MEAAKGRGARSNATGRYESFRQEAFDDGWTGDDADRFGQSWATARTVSAGCQWRRITPSSGDDSVTLPPKPIE